MNNKQHTKTFTPSEDALIKDQPVSRIGLKTLATLLRTSPEKILRRADELGVSLAIAADYDGLVDTRTRSRKDRLVDPLLEQLKRVHADRK